MTPARGSGGADDSAGQTWTGRELSASGFERDDGTGDPVLRELLAGTDEVAVTDRLADTRLLVPVVAAPTEVDTTGPLTVEASTEMAVVTLTGPDGTRALPVFTGVDSLATWDASARPSPVTAARAAAAALAEDCQLMLLDLGSPWGRTLRPSMVQALAARRGWLPAHRDAAVVEAVRAACDPEPACEAAECTGDADAGGRLRVVLLLRPGLDRAEVTALTTRVGERLAAEAVIRERVDELAVVLRTAGG